MSRPTVLPVLIAMLLGAAAPASAMPLGKIKLASHATTGSLTAGPGGDGTSNADFGENFDQAISNDGRYVSFLSDARNLQTAVTDDNSSTRLFRTDLITGAVQMVDVNAAGTHNADGPLGQLDQGFPNAPTASADGRYVVWHSGAQDLVSGFVDGAATDATASDVYLRDMQTGTTSLLSRSTSSAVNGGNGDSAYPVVTPNGRYVLMYSEATNLVSGITDTINTYDLFLRDVQSGTTTLVTAGPSGTATIANGGLDYYAMTPDAKYVIFSRIGNASDVIAGDTGSGYNVYRRNMLTGVTELLSPTVASATVAAGGVNSGLPPLLSDDGRYVVFSTTASTLVTPDTNGVEDVFLRDATDHTTTLVSHNAAGTDSASGGPSSTPRITPDGRYVVFLTVGSDLVASPPDAAGVDIFRFDRQSGTNTLVTPRADGTSTAGNPSINTFPLISDDGRYVAFESASTTLVTGFVNNNAGAVDVYKRDMTAGTTSLVSGQSGSSTAGGSDISRDPWMTPDGRFVSFFSAAPDLVSPGTSTIGNLYVRGNFVPQGLSINASPNALSFGFTGSATDPDGSIASFGWLFGDGASGSGATTSHTYAAPGTDTVTLTATDDDGESAQTTTSVSPTAPAGGGENNNGGGGGGNNGGGNGGGGGGGTLSITGTPKVSADGTTVTANVNCPGAGTLNGTLTSLGGSRAAKKPVLGTKTVTVTKAGRVVLKVRLNGTGRKLLRKKGKIKAKLTIAFKPKTGTKQTRSKTVTLRAPKKKH